ncbi:hypothetical protein B4P00_21990 [Shewanella xiamenensis]|jgi:hypothetical protein|uniref:hypothetical protein n=1 Tax=Shewanella xiamenensis TaxID=332186 RepID=UPI000849B8ED|nr:hypothetical protein [Shewanella xiamenensis]MBW0298841.1 hypothetical protein [Shewanella xiamenensis]ODR83782.1 hypothetical protein ABT47_23785 [Shewanella xiamenensis]
MGNPEWICDGFGIIPHNRGRWIVVFGDQDLWVNNGIYRNRRRAKKEITHYINKGLFMMRRGALGK